MEGPDVGIGLTRCGIKYIHASVPMGMQIMCMLVIYTYSYSRSPCRADKTTSLLDQRCTVREAVVRLCSQ